MAISIHHGPNGSYKTSGVIDQYFIKCAKEGRLVVTNVRGVSTERTFEHYPDTHDDFKVIYVDTSTKAGREKISRWFHWAPSGAFLLFDEPSSIFPKRWRDSDLKKLDNLEVINRMATEPDFNESHADYMPPTWNEGWEMHRHWNWDIVIMTPNIKLVRSDIRDTSEGGYKHRNNATIGFKGSYNQGFHKAEDNGTNPSQFLTVEKRKVRQLAFKLYDSTKTGSYQDTSAGTSIFKNGKLMVALVVATIAIGYSFFTFTNNDIMHQTAQVDIDEATPVYNVPVEKDIIPFNDLDSNVNDYVAVNTVYSLEPFDGHTFTINAALSAPDRFLYFFTAARDKSQFYLTSVELEEAGYSVIRISDCAATIVYKTKRINATCGSLIKSPRAGA